jgi:N-acetylmuramoyl-L-alanine amidase
MLRRCSLFLAFSLSASPALAAKVAHAKAARAPEKATAKVAEKPPAKPADKLAEKAEPAEKSELEEAKRALTALRLDHKRNRQRAPWLKLAGRFEAIQKAHPRSADEVRALFIEATLFDDLARISMTSEDADRAAKLYQQVVEGHATSNLADDAALALARLDLRRNQPDKARGELKALLASFPQGDMAEPARALLAHLPTPKEERAANDDAADDAAADDGAEEAAESPVPAPQPSAGVAALHPHATPIVPPETINGGRGAAADDDDDAADARQSRAVKPLSPAELARGALVPKSRLAVLKKAVREASTDLPLSAQMGLKVRRVVIDAGHGGHDVGAIGPGGTHEKDVALAVARKLGDKLRAQHLEVFLTRDDDKFVSLEKRAEFANDHRADLFISVHCNAGASKTYHGVETYSLNVASDRYAMRLAARENAASERSISDLQVLLADIATRSNTSDSRRLASVVQSSVVRGLKGSYDAVRDMGTKEALFYVLLGTRMPAILVETSFITNPDEEKRLKSEAYQEALAASIAAGVERFVDDRLALAEVPTAEQP